MKAPSTTSVKKSYESQRANSEGFSVQRVLDTYNSRFNSSSKFRDNISFTSQLTAEVFTKMKAVGINPSKAYVKVDGLNSFSVMVVIPKDDYLKPVIYPIISQINEIERQHRSRAFDLNFSILNSDGDHDEDAIATDGYLTFLSNLFP